MLKLEFGLLLPVLHGEAGPYDELINAIPLIVGGVVVLGFYLWLRRRRLPPADKK